MVRTFAIAATATVAAAAAAPRIELDLATPQEYLGKLERHADVGGAGQWSRFHAVAGSNNRGVQDFTERCPAGTGTNGANCPVPKAHAWDSHDEEIKVSKQIYLVDDDGQTGVVPADKVEYAKRRTYLIKYDASDAAGNRAEQLVFALILDDVKAPRITCDDWSTNGVVCDCSVHAKLGACAQKCASGADYVIEAASGFVSQSLVAKPDWSLCKAWTAFDLVEGYVNPTITYKVTTPLSNTPIIETNSWASANEALTKGHPIGRYTVVVSAHDHAGSYGKGAGGAGDTGNNVATFAKTFVFQDTQAPVVTVLGDSPNHTHECGTKYTDAGASAQDARDDKIALGVTYPKDKYTDAAKGLTVSSDVNANVNGAYKVTFSAHDSSNNWAKGERFVLVKDTKAPKVVLVGDNEVTRYVEKDDLDRIEELGISVNDACDPLLTGQVFTKAQPGGAASPKVSMTWSSNAQGQNPGNKWPITGKFVRTYRVWDTTSNGKSTTIKRTYAFVDNEEPDVKLVGKSTVTVEACNIKNNKACKSYVDEGARCFDYVGGEMGQGQIVKGGNAVDKTTPGTYTVTYKCKDNAPTPNWSEVVSRTVVVADTTCPTLKVLGANPTTIEANFPYQDAGATAMDEIDGFFAASSPRITATGNTVNTKSLYVQARSCKDIKAVVDEAKTGPYKITSYTKAKGFFQINVFCDMSNGSTYYLSKGQHAPGSAGVVPYGSKLGACGNMGLSMAKFPFTAAAMEEFSQIATDYKNNKENPTNVYLCAAKNDADASTHAAIRAANTKMASSRAEAGTYKITYHFTDSSNNKDTGCGAAPTTRAVKVQDTLPPVISLHMGGKLLKSSNKATGAANPAWDAAQNPFLNDGYFDAKSALMAEESASSANGWMIGAAASAVAGLALLASSRRTVATSVPV